MAGTHLQKFRVGHVERVPDADGIDQVQGGLEHWRMQDASFAPSGG